MNESEIVSEIEDWTHDTWSTPRFIVVREAENSDLFPKSSAVCDDIEQKGYTSDIYWTTENIGDYWVEVANCFSWEESPIPSIESLLENGNLELCVLYTTFEVPEESEGIWNEGRTVGQIEKGRGSQK